LIIALVAVVAALGVGGYFGYRMLLTDTVDSAATKSSPPAAATSSQPAEATKDTSLSTPAPPAAADSASTQQPAPPAPEAKSTASGAPAVPDAGGPAATGADASKAAVVATPKADAGKAVPRAATSPVPKDGAPVAPDPSRTVAAPAPARSTPSAAAIQPNRWQQMAEAMAQCQREDFFSRVGCQQRVGRRFCEGYWGTVPQCPAGAPKETAQ
jgi:hypothetical protein